MLGPPSSSLRPGVRVGLCGWTVAQARYVREFPLVEVQHTFYEPPSDDLLRKWRAAVPNGFEFTLKAWQMITHDGTSPTYRRMRQPLPDDVRALVGSFRSTEPVVRAWTRTVQCAELLDASAILLQCPRRFRPTAENVARLHAFFDTVDRPPRQLLWEPRGDWPDRAVAELCRVHDLVHVVDPMQRDTLTPDRTYFRLHGTSGARHVHTDDELRRVRDLVHGRPIAYVLFNNLPRVGDAERFIELL